MKAYIDSFAGLVPCKVTRIEHDAGLNYVTVTVTGRKNRAYKAGQVLTMTGRAIVPREKVTGLRRMSGPRIAPYDWQAIAPELIKRGKV
jgi:hypothetical protein